MISRLKRCLTLVMLCQPLWVLADTGNRVTGIDFASLPSDQFEVSLQFSQQPPEPQSYEIAQPARLVLDFAGVQSALGQKKYPLAFENARDAVVVSDGNRTRLIVNLLESVPFDTRIEGDRLIVVVGADRDQQADFSKVSQIFSGESPSLAVPTAGSELDAALTGVDFRRDEEGGGLIVVDLTDPSVNIDINRTGGKIRLAFYQTELPQHLDRRLDVVDFATPVTAIDTVQEGSATVISIEAQGQYDYLAYQTDKQYMVSIKPLTAAEVELQNKKFDFTGDRLSLNFQDIEVRSVLQLIADFTSLNLVASDTVTGSITLRLDKVPWDQALEIVLKAKGLDKRQEGNVLMVAPAAEIAEQERLQVEANKQLQELAPLETAFVRIKYADAAEIFELFTADDDQQGQSGVGAGGREGNATTSILSQRGSAIVDERTNTIILTDTEDKINEFKRLIMEIDVPIKQVLIEARIVIANTDFKKELGVTWGLAGIDKLSGGQFSSATGDRSLGFSGRRSDLTPGAGVVETFTYQADEEDTAGPDGQVGTPDDTIVVTQNYDFGLGDSLAVDLGVSDPTGSFSLGYLTDSFLIDLELSALESDGYGEIVSQPKVLTGDKQ